MLYLDPSAGSMGFQMIVGGLLTALGVVRLYWRRVKSLLSPQFMQRRVEILSPREGDVLKAPAERVVAPDRHPVDPEG